jgi:8-oxo-dGTP diphosphatase
MNKISVVAAVIQAEDRFLICLRPEGKRHAGMWEFPGGKVDAGESISDALRRELKEELDLDVTSVGRVLSVHADPDSAFEISFIETTVSGNITVHEHDRAEWVRLSVLDNYPLAPSDKLFVEEMLGSRFQR